MSPLVICLSGKRKSGKDYVSSLLKEIFQSEGCKVIIRGISYPLKEEYAKLHHLDAEDLKTDGPYKETFREDMVAWGEAVRTKDPHYFCRLVAEETDGADVLIFSDCRRPSDIEYFRERFGKSVSIVRVVSDVAVRESRGFSFTKGIDDKDTECALDDFDGWDYIIVNNGGALKTSSSSSLSADLKNLAVKVLEMR